MKKVLIGLLALIVIYFVGPKPDAPVLNPSPTWTQIPDSMPQISEFIQQKELENKELKPTFYVGVLIILLAILLNSYLKGLNERKSVKN